MDQSTVQSAKVNLLDTLNRPTNFNDWLQGAHYSSSYVTQLERTDNACSQAIRSSNAAMAASFKSHHRRPPRDKNAPPSSSGNHHHHHQNPLNDPVKLLSSRGSGRQQQGRRRKSSSLLSPSSSPLKNRRGGGGTTTAAGSSSEVIAEDETTGSPPPTTTGLIEDGEETTPTTGHEGQHTEDTAMGEDGQAHSSTTDRLSERRRRRPLHHPRKRAKAGSLEQQQQQKNGAAAAGEDGAPAPMNSAEIRDHLRESYYQMKSANAFGNTFPALLTPLNRPVFHVYDEPDLPNRYRPGVAGFGGAGQRGAAKTSYSSSSPPGGSPRPNQEWRDMTRGMMTGRSYDYPYQNEVLNQTCLRNLLLQPGGPPAFYPSATRPRRGAPKEMGPYYV